MSGSSGGSSKTTTTSYTPEQAQWMSKALDIYGPSLGQGQVSYPGTRVAPLATGQAGVLSNIPNLLSSLGMSTDMPLYGETGTTLSGLLSGDIGAQPITPEVEGDYFARAIKQPTMKQFKEETLPGIKESFAGPGYWGSARANEVAEAYQDVGDWLGQQRAQLAWDTQLRNQEIQEAKAGRALGAVAPAMTYDQTQLRNTLAQIAGGEEIYKLASMEQGQQQNVINATIEKFREGQRLTDPEIMTIMLTLLGTSYQTTTEKQEAGGSLAGLGSALGAGLALMFAPVSIGALGGAAIGGAAGSAFNW